MKIELFKSYVNQEDRLAELDAKIAEVEETLKTPSRTVEDIILHIKLVKERQSLTKSKPLCYS